MAPSDGMKIIRSQGEAQRLPTAADGQANVISRFSNHGAFHRFMDLPSMVREQIRIEAITERRGDFREEDPEKPCFPLAVVSKEWVDDVEEALFSEIQIDTLDDQEVSSFKELFSTDRRKHFLTRLDIAIDDTEETGPWHQEGGIVQIAHLMETIGKFLRYINGWSLFRKDGSQRTIEIVVVTSYWKPRFHNTTDKDLSLITKSFWDEDDRKLLTANGLHPINLPLRAIKSEFPSSLEMIKHLGFPPDLLPLSATRRIIQGLPNLETCLLELKFWTISEEAWRDFIDVIHELRASAPSLHNLMMCNPVKVDRRDDFSPNMIEFASLLRDYSQRLESLRANPFELDREFFLPFSLRIVEVKSPDKTWNTNFAWRWLKHLDLQFLDDESIDGDQSIYDDECTDDDEQDSDASPDSEARRKSWFKPGTTWFPTNKLDAQPRVPRDELRLSPADILIAAGRAAWFMPVLRSAHISVTSGHGIFVKRKLPYGHGGPPISRVYLTRCSAFEEQEILRAWQPTLGCEPTVDPDLESEFFDPQLPDSDSDDSESKDPGCDDNDRH